MGFSCGPKPCCCSLNKRLAAGRQLTPPRGARLRINPLFAWAKLSSGRETTFAESRQTGHRLHFILRYREIPQHRAVIQHISNGRAQGPRKGSRSECAVDAPGVRQVRLDDANEREYIENRVCEIPILRPFHIVEACAGAFAVCL